MSYIDSIKHLRFEEFVHPPEHCHIASRWMSAESTPDIHSHDFYEVFWVDRGQGFHLINGETRPLRRGTLSFIRADDRHGFAAETKRPYRIKNVAFARDTWRYLMNRYGAERDDPMRGAPADREILLGSADLSALEVASTELAEDRRRIAIERFLLNLLHLRHRIRNLGSGRGRAPRWLTKACEEIRQQRRFAEGTPALVALADRSAEHVSREAKRFFGKTPTDLVNEARLEHAAIQLMESDDTVIEIALQCGYENISHFYRLFRARYGTSPGEYRLTQQRIIRSAD